MTSQKEEFERYGTKGRVFRELLQRDRGYFKNAVFESQRRRLTLKKVSRAL